MIPMEIPLIQSAESPVNSSNRQVLEQSPSTAVSQDSTLQTAIQSRNNESCLENPVSVNTRRESFKCSKCPLVTSNSLAYSRHLKLHRNAQHICSICSRAFPSKSSLALHEKTYKII